MLLEGDNDIRLLNTSLLVDHVDGLNLCHLLTQLHLVGRELTHLGSNDDSNHKIDFLHFDLFNAIQSLGKSQWRVGIAHRSGALINFDLLGDTLEVTLLFRSLLSDHGGLVVKLVFNLEGVKYSECNLLLVLLVGLHQLVAAFGELLLVASLQMSASSVFHAVTCSDCESNLQRHDDFEHFEVICPFQDSLHVWLSADCIKFGYHIVDHFLLLRTHFQCLLHFSFFFLHLLDAGSFIGVGQSSDFGVFTQVVLFHGVLDLM